MDIKVHNADYRSVVLSLLPARTHARDCDSRGHTLSIMAVPTSALCPVTLTQQIERVSVVSR